MKAFSLTQKIFILKNYYRNNENLVIVRDEFQNQFEIRAHDSIFEIFNSLVQLFEETGSVLQEIYYNLDEEEEERPESRILRPADVLQITNELCEEAHGQLLGEAAADGDEKEGDDEDTGDDEDYVPDGLTELGIDKNDVADDHFPCNEGSASCVCPICKKFFSSKRNLARHMKTHVESERQFTCDLCSKTFKNVTQLRNHKYCHLPLADRPHFECDICGKRIAGRDGLRKHRRIHTDTKDYVCEWCGKGFLKSTGLKMHLRIHTGERPYPCNLCDRSFSTSGSRVIHLRTHTGERPYKCKYCDKRFVDNSTRNVHHRQHTGENPYICHLCGKSCKQAQNLRSHIRHIHSRDHYGGSATTAHSSSVT